MREDNNYEKSNSDPAPISPAANSSHDENEHVDPEALWVKVVPNLQKKFGQHAFNRWFKNSQLALTSSGDWALQVPSETHALWIDTNFVDDLNDALASELHDKNLNSIKVEVASLKTVSEKGPQSGEEQTSTESSLGENELFPDADFSKPGSSEAVHKQRAKQARLNPTNVFDRFVVGGSNEFAHAACLAISQGHGAAYNPLFLHGDSGMGKTHLVQALGHELLKRRPKAKVIYLTCERFTNEFIEAVQKGNLDRFRSNYRKADVLMVDDVQFLSGKEKSGDEFFPTFNALLDLQAQIILTSDRPACEIQTLEPRLVSRFESGLTVALQPPSLEMRIAILQKKMEEWHVNLPNQTLVYIAERVKSNVRRLEGALVRVATYSRTLRGLAKWPCSCRVASPRIHSLRSEKPLVVAIMAPLFTPARRSNPFYRPRIASSKPSTFWRPSYTADLLTVGHNPMRACVRANFLEL